MTSEQSRSQDADQSSYLMPNHEMRPPALECERCDSSWALDGRQLLSRVLMLLLLAQIVPVVCNADSQATVVRGDNLDGVVRLPDTAIAGIDFMRWAIMVPSSVEDIWFRLNDSSEIIRHWPMVKQYVVLETNGDSSLILCAAKPKWYLKTYRCTVSVARTPQSMISWERTGGDFRDLRCYWRLLPVSSDTTIAVFGIHLDAGGVIPSFLLRMRLTKLMTNAVAYCRNWLSKPPVQSRH
jgi:ribosome-associated toxin RatA of RatAB toxin-antitoxin module